MAFAFVEKILQAKQVNFSFMREHISEISVLTDAPVLCGFGLAGFEYSSNWRRMPEIASGIENNKRERDKGREGEKKNLVQPSYENVCREQEETNKMENWRMKGRMFRQSGREEEGNKGRWGYRM